MRYHFAEDADALSRGLRAAYARPGATLVHVRVRPTSYQEATELLAARLQALAGAESP